MYTHSPLPPRPQHEPAPYIQQNSHEKTPTLPQHPKERIMSHKTVVFKIRQIIVRHLSTKPASNHRPWIAKQRQKILDNPNNKTHTENAPKPGVGDLFIL
jgi:hypothetical protein